MINGSKMFTTGAHNCQYVFLITNTHPGAPKHKSLTMFLVPLGTPGIEIQGIRTVDGDRTNIVYYSDVRVDDKYRLGEVNGGWTVLREPLNVEHGAVAAASDGLQDVSIMMHQAGFMADAVDKAAAVVGRSDPNGHRLIDDQSVAYRLGRSVARMEAALSAPSIFGRVALAQTMRDISPDLMDILGDGIVVTSWHRWCRRRRCCRVHLPVRAVGRHLRRHARGVPQHDRAARSRTREAELLAAGGQEGVVAGRNCGEIAISGSSWVDEVAQALSRIDGRTCCPDSFGECAIRGCHADPGGMRVRRHQPDDFVVGRVRGCFRCVGHCDHRGFDRR